MSKLFTQLFGRNMTANRIATLNFIDRFLAYSVIYTICELSVINPLIGGFVAFAAEALVVRYALKKLGK